MPLPALPQLKRFALFSGMDQYPRGGWGDFMESFDTLSEALAARCSDCEWHQVIDLMTGEELSELPSL